MIVQGFVIHKSHIALRALFFIAMLILNVLYQHPFEFVFDFAYITLKYTFRQTLALVHLFLVSLERHLMFELLLTLVTFV